VLTPSTRPDIEDITYFLIAIALRLRNAFKWALWLCDHIATVLEVSLAALLTSTNDVAHVNASDIKCHLTTSRNGGKDDKDISKHRNRLSRNQRCAYE